MLSHLLRRSISLTYTPYLYQVSKKKQRLEKKLQEEHAVKSMDHLETAIEQQNYTEEQLDVLLQEKQEQYKEYVAKSTSPAGTVLALTASLLPLMGMCGGIFGMYQYQYMTQYIPILYMSAIKYAGINICFQSGFHWGIALQMHECQKDSLNSSKQARYLFLLSALPIFGVMYLLNELQQNENDIQLHFMYIGGLVFANIYTLLLDAVVSKYQLMPFWLIKMKLPYCMILNVMLIGLQVGIQNVDEKYFQQAENVYKRSLKDKNELLQ